MFDGFRPAVPDKKPPTGGFFWRPQGAHGETCSPRGNAQSEAFARTQNAEASASNPFLLKWRHAVCSSAGRKQPNTRLVLMVLSLFMSMGGGAFPSRARLAVNTGLGLATEVRISSYNSPGTYLSKSIPCSRS